MAAILASPPTDLPAAPQSPGDVTVTTRLPPEHLSDRETPPSRAGEESELRREEIIKPEVVFRSCTSTQAQEEVAPIKLPRPLREVLEDRFAAVQAVSDLMSDKQREKAEIRRRAIYARQNAVETTGESREEWRRVLRECDAQEAQVIKEIEALTSERCARTKEKDATFAQLAAARRRSRGSKEHLRLLKLVWGLQRDDKEVDGIVDELLDEVVAEDKDVEAQQVDTYLDELLDDLAAEESGNEAAEAPVGKGEVETKEENLEGSEAELASAPIICVEEGVAVKPDEGRELQRGEVKGGKEGQSSEERHVPFSEKVSRVLSRALADAEAEDREEQERLKPKLKAPAKNSGKHNPNANGEQASIEKISGGRGADVSSEGVGFVYMDDAAREKEQRDRKATIEAILRRYHEEEKRAEEAAREKAKGKLATNVVNKAVEMPKGFEKIARKQSLPPSTSDALHMGSFPDSQFPDHSLDVLEKESLLWAIIAMLAAGFIIYSLLF